ncbi:hypothetical protein M8818_007679 [Zalaria obscura]|uniref:Uncharacterized protein n=1 Tax=Zalaria obscura TaxID=2024903 RepID=A0ACC3S2H4_9PEZI
MDDGSGPNLPDDLLHLICIELAERFDFNTLYSCAVSSKHLAGAGALANLYRISHDSPVKGGGNEALPFAEQELNVQRWSILWRTIILSSFDETPRLTLFPYSRYLKALDMKDLSYLLEDDKFRGKIAKNFFQGKLQRFNINQDALHRAGKPRRAPRLDTRKIISDIGDLITEQAPMLEALSEPIIGDMFSTALLRWAPRLSKLQELQFWNGKALEDETIQNLLCAHCPQLNKLSIFQWSGDAADRHLGQFLNTLRQNSLTEFQNISNCGIGLETCLGLGSHGKSLKTLKLALTAEGLPGLGVLKDCTSMETFELEDLRPPNDLQTSHNDIFLDMVEWLKQCSSLREISLTNFVSAPALLEAILSGSDIQLEKLEINATKEDCLYVVKDHQAFHLALSQQRNLRSLLLKANPDPPSRDDLEILCSTLCALTELRELKLSRTSDYFTDSHVHMLAQSLVNLEDLYVSGYGITDNALISVSSLGNLKSANFSGLTYFTKDGLLNFVDRLGPGNQGLAVFVDAADPDRGLTDMAQDQVREALAEKVQGRFEYQLLRDPNMSEFDQSDSD